MDLEKVLQFLLLLCEVGEYLEDGKMIIVGIGCYGLFVLYDGIYVNLFLLDEVFFVGINWVVDVLVEKCVKGGGCCGVVVILLKEFGEYLDEGGVVNVYDGCYGLYVKYGKINVILLKDSDLQVVIFEQVLELIVVKVVKGGIKKKVVIKKMVVKKIIKKVVLEVGDKKLVVKKIVVKKVVFKKVVVFKIKVDMFFEEVFWDDVF